MELTNDNEVIHLYTYLFILIFLINSTLFSLHILEAEVFFSSSFCLSWNYKSSQNFVEAMLLPRERHFMLLRFSSPSHTRVTEMNSLVYLPLTVQGQSFWLVTIVTKLSFYVMCCMLSLVKICHVTNSCIPY